MFYHSLPNHIPSNNNNNININRQKEVCFITDWNPTDNNNINNNNNVDGFFNNFMDGCTDTNEKKTWNDLLTYLNDPLPTSVPWSQPNNEFANSVESPMGYGVNRNPMLFGGAVNTGHNSASNNMSNAQCFGESSIKNAATSVLQSVAHSSAQNQTSYYTNTSFLPSTNGVQPNFQNNYATFLESLPRRWWMRPLSMMNQSNRVKIPQLNSCESMQGRPFVTAESSSHNCNGLNCSICGPATFGMPSRKRKINFGAPGNESWSGTGDIMGSRKRNYPLGSSNNYESWVGDGSLTDMLTKTYLPPDDLPSLEQWPSSEDASGSDAMGSGVDGKDVSSQPRSNEMAGTLMEVYTSFIKSSASRKDAVPNGEDALGPSVNKVPPALSCEEKGLCEFNSVFDDYESVWESMQSMEPIGLELEKTSTQMTSVDHNGSEMEATNIKEPSPSVYLADPFEDNGSGSGSMNIEKPSSTMADSLEDNGSSNIKKPSASLTDSLTAAQIKEHLSSFIQPEKVISESTTPSESQNLCQLCSKNNLLLAPTPVYCSSCDLRIKQNVKYYRSTDEDTKTQQCICMRCFKGSRGSSVITRAGSVSKTILNMAVNDEEVEDSWVQCDTCQQWQHRICGLYNNETDLEGKAEYVCPKCCLKEIENGTRISLPKTVMGAKDLPRTNLSDHIEQRLFTRMKQEREETAKFLGKALEEVPVAEGLVVRVVVSVDKELEVKKQFRDIFHGQDYPEKNEYRSKLILLFQKIGGVDVCLFGMYVQEFGSECNGPNNRCVYISYIDSVKYFQPERKTASGEPLRTFVYHEILIGYLEHCKKRGFATCYIWSCPLIKGEDYIFYCHPKTQKTPEKTKLLKWYKLMIKKAMEDGIVVDQTNLYNEFFTPSNAKISAARLPNFDGDCWSDAAVNISKELENEESSGGKFGIKSRTNRILMAKGQESHTKDALVMHNLGELLVHDKENYMIVRLQHMCTSCNEVILSGSRWFCNQCNKIQLCSRCVSPSRTHKCGSCKDKPLSEDVLGYIPHDTKDIDDVLVNKLFETRDEFLNKCQNSLYQFDTLGHAKYSSMMILYHYMQNLVVQTKGDTCHTDKLIPPSTEVPCETRKQQSQDQNQTEVSCETRKEQNQDTVTRALNALTHASQCKSVEGCSPDCQTVKMLLQHVTTCTRRRRNGCQNCQGAWWILENHVKICTNVDCSIPYCKYIREQRANAC